jgi:hypothetical protein
MAVCRHANNKENPKEFTCYPSLETLASEAGLTLRSVQRTMPKLTDRKLVEIISKGNGRGIKYKFLVNVEALRNSDENDDIVTPFEGKAGADTLVRPDMS